MMKNRFLGILLCCMALLPAFGQGAFSFKINEVVTSNAAGLVDEYGDRSGWIEIANTSWGTNNIRSCYLTTNRAALNPELSAPERIRLMSLIPKGDSRTNLTAKQNIVFFADGHTNRGMLHTNFCLNVGEENFIALFDGNGVTLLDSVTVPPLAENQSFARVYNGATESYEWIVMEPDNVTPGSPNAGQGKVQDKIAEFKEKDPYGVAMSVMAMAIVFSCLILLYVFFRLFGYIVSLMAAMTRVRAIRAIRNKAHQASVMAKQGLETKGIDMEVYMAVIAMALKEYEENVHDVESNVLTLQPDEHTEWNAKDNAMREWPKLY